MDSILSTVNINLFLPHSILPAESKSIIKLMPFIQEGFSLGMERRQTQILALKAKLLELTRLQAM